MINGVINVYKEKGYTSHDVVAKLRGILKQKKIGHTGTLDPDAEGVLPVCLGKATKLCDMLTDTDKRYRVVMQLGCVTDTQDMTGKILSLVSQEEISSKIDIEDIEKAITSFKGEYDQIPPMYSALKVNGKKLYEYAREGKEIERKPRRIKILDIDLIEINMETARAVFEVSCSKGTYIRALCNDIGEKLGCGACMLSLLRTRAAGFDIESAVKIDDIVEIRDKDNLEGIVIPIDRIFENNKKITAKDSSAKLLYNGNKLAKDNFIEEPEPDDKEEFRVYDEKNRFIGIYYYDMQKDIFEIKKMFFDMTEL